MCIVHPEGSVHLLDISKTTYSYRFYVSANKRGTYIDLVWILLSPLKSYTLCLPSLVDIILIFTNTFQKFSENRPLGINEAFIILQIPMLSFASF